MKRLFCLSLTILCLITVAAESADYSGGDGTAENPYRISSGSDMNEIGAHPDDWDAHFILTADIDLSDYTGMEFNIIGNAGTPFTGSFDGNGHTIANFTYVGDEGDNIGIFGYANNSKTEIKNLGLIEPDIVFTGASNQQWSRAFGGNSDDVGNSMQVTSDGGYIITGITNSFGAGGDDVYLIKIDAWGNEEWSRTFGGSFYDRGYSVQTTQDGGYIVTGYTGSLGAGNADVFLIKTDTNGIEEWSRTFGGGDMEKGYSVQVTGEGGYIIAGSADSFGAGSTDVYLIKTDSAGNEEWSRTFGGSSCDAGRFVQVTSDGGYIITGSADSFGAGSADVYLIKTDSAGNEEWSRTFGGSSVDYGQSVRATEDGGYIVVGYTQSFGAGWHDVYLIKTDSAGNEEWSRTFGGGSDDKGYSVQITHDGSYIIAGYTRSLETGYIDVWLIKTDATGNEVWNRTFGGGSSYDAGYSLQVTNVKDYIIAGYTSSGSAGSADVYLLKTSANGQGALIGYLAAGRLSGCMVKGGLVTGTGEVGALVGRSGGLIEDCYSTTAVSLTGVDGVAGGLIGKNEGGINRCFATGGVDSAEPDLAGGLVGSSLAGTVTGSFWDAETSGKSNSAGGTGLTTIQMQMENTFTSAGWDIVSIWEICDGFSYPQFLWEDGICIDVIPTMLNFEAPLDGPDPNSQVLSISNCLAGELTLNWEITVGGDGNWLNVCPIVGQATGEIDEVTLSVDTTGLDIGFYNCELTVSDNNAENSPQTVQVSLHVYIEGQRHVPDEYDTIQAAIDAAVDGDEVIIHPSRYTGRGNYNINFIGKAITVRSTDPNNPLIIDTTIIDPGYHSRGFWFSTGEEANSVLDGLTITRGYSGGYGGGISCRDSCPTIRNCVIRDCSVGSHGGGIYLSDSNSLIENCVIKNNVAYEVSGGIACGGGSPTIVNCLITNNSLCGIGSYRSNLTVKNCTIAENKSLWYADGSGITFYDGGVSTVFNNIIWGNHDAEENEIIINQYQADPVVVTISYCDIDGGQSAIYVDPCCTLNWGEGNIDIDPCFAEPGYWDTNGTPTDSNDDLWVDGDYHLKSQAGRWNPKVYRACDLVGDGTINLFDFAEFAKYWHKQGDSLPADLNDNNMVDSADLKLFLDNYLTSYTPGAWVVDDVNSLCIDAGDPNSDWTAELWPHGKRINMGAYGGTPQASMSLSSVGNIANLDNDAADIVDFGDLAMLVEKWCEKDILLAADLNHDGVVDFTDYAIFASHWLEGFE